MGIKYEQANKVLTEEFLEMKVAFENDPEEYDDGDIHSCYTLYEREFTPYVLRQLRKNNKPELKKIFDFLEKLFTEGDEMIVNLVGVAVVESLYFDGVCDSFKDTLQKFCGNKTLQSFYDSLSDDERTGWGKSLAA